MSLQPVSSLAAITRSRLVTDAGQTSVADVAKLPGATQISLVVITGSHRAMVGVITKTDIVRKIGKCTGQGCMTSAEKIMTRDVTFCEPHDVLLDVLFKMDGSGFVHLPVVDRHLLPIGVINAKHALRELLADEQYEESLLRNYVMGIEYQ